MRGHEVARSDSKRWLRVRRPDATPASGSSLASAWSGSPPRVRFGARHSPRVARAPEAGRRATRRRPARLASRTCLGLLRRKAAYQTWLFAASGHSVARPHRSCSRKARASPINADNEIKALACWGSLDQRRAGDRSRYRWSDHGCVGNGGCLAPPESPTAFGVLGKALCKRLPPEVRPQL
jgi:hypothetical protein